MKKKINNYSDKTVNLLFNALLELWDKPQSKKKREIAEKVLQDVYELKKIVFEKEKN